MKENSTETQRESSCGNLLELAQRARQSLRFIDNIASLADSSPVPSGTFTLTMGDLRRLAGLAEAEGKPSGEDYEAPDPDCSHVWLPLPDDYRRQCKVCGAIAPLEVQP